MPVDYGPAADLLARLDGDEKHEPSAFSTFSALHVLYHRVLHVDPADPAAPDRDRFLLSKGHGPQAYYAMLAARGFFPPAWLDGFAAYDSPLGHHPDRTLVPGVEASSGSLGHGLPLAVGVALALRAQGRTRPRVFCLVGDGELDEGSNHEAIAFAGRVALASLTVIAVDNASATYGWPGGISARFAREGWATETVDGHDDDALERALRDRHSGRPNVVVAEVRSWA
jgi:transketolase